ncbi:MAG: DUF1127 domain-containing protein [Pseudoruegeria sp.]
MARPLSQHNRNIQFLEANHPLPAMGAMAVGFAVLLTKWRMRYHTRLALKTLTESELRDVGLSRRQAYTEARRPFWSI